MYRRKGARVIGPLGCISPYSSVTEYAAVLAFTPELVSLITPETVTGTDLPFGGHNVFGLAPRAQAARVKPYLRFAGSARPCGLSLNTTTGVPSYNAAPWSKFVEAPQRNVNRVVEKARRGFESRHTAR